MVSMVLIEEDVSIDWKHPRLPLEDRTRVWEGAEAEDLDQCGVASGGEDNGDGLHGACVQETPCMAQS